MPDESDPALLVVGPSWVGDMVIAQALFIDQKTRNPETPIDVLAPAWSAGIVGRMPEVRELVESPFVHGKFDLQGRRRVAARLRDKSYSRVIILPNSWKSALVPALARIPDRTGYVGEQRWGLLTDIRRLDKEAMPMIAQRFVALGRSAQDPVPGQKEIPVPRLHADPAKTAETCAEFGIDGKDGSMIVICPGAEFGPAKRWPAEHFRELTGELTGRGHHVVLLGSRGDHEIGEMVTRGLDPAGVTNLCGETSLAQVVDIMSMARLAVSNDSGLMHIAAASGVPLVAIYGSTDPGFTPPLGEGARVIRLGLECSPCFQRECPLGHLDCLNGISVEMVAGECATAMAAGK